MPSAVIIAAARTPLGKFQGSLSSLKATELGAHVVREVVRRANVPVENVDEVILGMVLQAGAGQAPARQAALGAGLPDSVGCLTVNKVCGSGLKAVMLADQAIRCGDARVIVAGGMESMTRAPYLLSTAREGFRLGNATAVDCLIHDGLWCATGACHMGEHAEFTAARGEVSRDSQDRAALLSHQRASEASARGAFVSEIVPLRIAAKGRETIVDRDEAPRADATLESLARLKPVFQSDGTVTAGNASALSDGAAAVVVVDERTAAERPGPWRARIVASYTAGRAPRELFWAPIDAVQGVLQRAGWSVDDVDLFEINEAFASQLIVCQRALQLDPARVNVQGGSIALGHPIGASGARVLVTLLSALEQRGLRRGLASLCLGGGNAVAMLVERM